MTIDLKYTDKTEEVLANYPVFKRLAAILPSWVNALGFPHDFVVGGRSKDNEPLSKVEFHTTTKAGQKVSVIFDLPKDTETDDDLRVLVMHRLLDLSKKLTIAKKLEENSIGGSALAALVATILLDEDDMSFKGFFEGKHSGE